MRTIYDDVVDMYYSIRFFVILKYIHRVNLLVNERRVSESKKREGSSTRISINKGRPYATKRFSQRKQWGSLIVPRKLFVKEMPHAVL